MTFDEFKAFVADYDADGATACALGVSVLQELGADVRYLVPNRFEYGYGLTPEIVELAARRRPHARGDVEHPGECPRRAPHSRYPRWCGDAGRNRFAQWL